MSHLIPDPISLYASLGMHAAHVPCENGKPRRQAASEAGLKRVTPTARRNWLGQPRKRAVPGSVKAALVELDAGIRSGIPAPDKMKRNALYSVARRLCIRIMVRDGMAVKRKD